MGFEEALAHFASTRVEIEHLGAVRLFTAEPNRFPTYNVQAYEDGFALDRYRLTQVLDQIQATQKVVRAVALNP